MLDSASNKLQTNLGKNLKHIDRDLALKSQKCSNLQGDSMSIINDNDTQVSINSINSLQTKIFSQNFENYRIQNQQEFMLDNSIYAECCADKFLLSNIPLNQSSSMISDDNDYDYNENILNNSIFQKTQSESSSIKSPLSKRVTFQDLSLKSPLQQSNLCCNNQEKSIKQLFSFEKSQVEQMISSQSAYQSNQSSSQKVKKSILKKSKTFELNFKKEKEGQQEIPTQQSNMDFCNIRNEELIQILLENETYNSKYLRKYFFSDMTTKISSSGERKSKIIMLTHNSFYVLQDYSNYKHIQKFDISQINKITINPEYQNVCSIVVKNQFLLNLQINHFKEFIQFIQNIFKSVLKMFIPIIFDKQKQKFIQQSNINVNNKVESKMESFLNSKKKEFYIQIMLIENNILQHDSKTIGLLQFFQNKILITALQKHLELNRLTEVDLFEICTYKRQFMFKSLRNPDHLYLTKLLDDQEFQQCLSQLQNFENQIK
ncbi:hypothetical protein TTHERM_00085520 (macronuclear) [Tetrahymena thermophila SB210]|uniref:Uncharacterized protein n=1 Tax=Tetrahymena thermophila (strain SB210) TaxID=312017 RepID=Q236P6_TETTS|nr:hypothetical protein TTHERM_00085520 [Tetrahymena thermophila SB210]EAR92454.2 hypothetical protein TTHERM_00085520 [Tetrahymena thermophila SB210]|eukprot:XP_001012699.2 hypothetical protein TTHERM_00085520 [Tetrahymena thermophila SB210]